MEGGEKGSDKWENSYEHSLNAGCRIMVCEDEGELKVLDYDPYGTEHWVKEYARQKDHNLCAEIWKRKSHIARPGDSERGIEMFNGSINYQPHHSTNITYVKQETPKIEFVEDANGMYSLGVSGELEMATIYKSERTSHYVCDNRDVKITFEYAPDMPSKANYDKEGNCYISAPSVPVVRLLCFHAEKIGLQGSKTVYERIFEHDGYKETAIASWEFKRISTSCDCSATIDIAKGDVKVDGKPVNSNTVLDNPQQVSTGANGRAQITFGNGNHIAIGPNNKIDLSSLCNSVGPGSIYMSIMSTISILTGSGSNFNTTVSNAVTGFRGEFLPNPEPFRPNIKLASYKGGSFAFSTVAFDEKKFNEVMPDSEDIERAAAGLLIEPQQSGFNIWVLKGKFKLKDSTGFSTTLQCQENTVVGQMPTPYHIKTNWMQIRVSE